MLVVLRTRNGIIRWTAGRTSHRNSLHCPHVGFADSSYGVVRVGGEGRRLSRAPAVPERASWRRWPASVRERGVWTGDDSLSPWWRAG